MDRYDVTGKVGHYFVRRGGKFVLGPYKDRALAEAARDRLLRKERSCARACISCGDAFLSEGPHNRMCDPCRENPDRAIHIAWGKVA